MKNLKTFFSNDILKVGFFRLLLAFLIALILPALIGAIGWNTFFFERYQSGKGTFAEYLNMLRIRFLFLYVIGFFLSLLFGVPAFYALRRHVAFKMATVCLVAAAISILPNILIEIYSNLENSGSMSMSIGDCRIIENSRRTLCGWKQFLIDNILKVALKGALAGAIFWLVMKFKRPVTKDTGVA